MKKNLVNTILSITVMTVLIVLYGLSLYLSPPKFWESAVLTTVIYGLFAISILRFVPHLTSLLSGEEQPHLIRTGDRTYRRCGTREIGKLILFIMAFRLVQVLFTYLIHYFRFGYGSTFFEVQRIWLDFYNPETQFPLYGYLSRVFWIFTFNFNHARFIGSFVFTAGAGAALYALALSDFNRQIARRAVRFLFFLPVSCLLLGTVPDGLFLLLSTLALLMMRKRRFALANFLSMLAVTTHAYGIVLFFPILASYIAYLIGNYRAGKEMGKGYLFKQIAYSASFLLIPIGVALVFLYSYLQFHDASACYRAAFGQFSVPMPATLFCYFDATIESTMVVSDQTLPTLLATVLPQVVYLIGACVLILVGTGKIDTSFVLMMIVSLTIVLSKNDMSEAAQWLTVISPFALAIAAAVKRRWVNYLLLVVFAAGWILYFYAFIIGYTGGAV